jgi:hypothetical protein
MYNSNEYPQVINFNDDLWRKCNYFYLESNDEGLSVLFIVTLDKNYTIDCNKALRSTAIRMAYEKNEYSDPLDETEFLDLERLKHILDYNEVYINCVKPISNKYGFNRVSYLANEIPLCDKGYKLYKNGEFVNSLNLLLSEHEIIRTVAFKDIWNDIVYFFECENKWLLATWCTGA